MNTLLRMIGAGIALVAISATVASAKGSTTQAPTSNPVPVPDAVIAPDVADFSKTEEIPVGSGAAGSERTETSADPDPDAFVPDATMPNVDLMEIVERLVYPEDARRNDLEGKVILRVLVDTNGVPVKCLIDHSDHEIFNQPTIDAVMGVRFTPGKQSGKLIKAWVSIPVMFKLD